MGDAGLTSEQRAAIAVHNATQNRMCLNLSGNGQICVACSEVADQIDAAVEVERQRSQAALAAARRECEGLRARVDGLRRLYTNDYLSWSKAGGPNECPHGRAAGIHCRTCDHIAETKAHEEDESRAVLAAPAAGEEGT